MKSIEHARDPLLRKSVAAMHRAAQRARRLALATHTDLIVAKEGRWQRINPAHVQETSAEYGMDNTGTDHDNAS